MIVDFVTNNKEIFDFVKSRDGGRGVDGVYFILKNIPLSVRRIDCLEDFYEDIDRFIREEGIDLNACGYRVFDWRREMVRNIGNINPVVSLS